MTDSIDDLLAQAADDLTVAVGHFDGDGQRPQSQAEEQGRGRRPWLLVAAAVVVCVVGAAALIAQRSTPATVRTDTPASPTNPTPTPSTDALEDASPQRTSTPEVTAVDTTLAPSTTTQPVADPFAFVPASGSVPAGFGLVDVADTLGQTPPGLPDPFHGIVAAVDDAGVPIDPIVHVELPEGPSGLQGETTPIQVGAVEGTYRVWQDQFTGIAAPQAGIEWSIDGTQVMVSGPDELELLLSVAEGVVLATDNGVDLDPPDGLVWWPGNVNLGQSGPTLQYLGPGLAQLLVTTERTQPGGLYADALRLYTSPDALTTVDGLPAQVNASEWGITLLAVETGTGYTVTIRQDDPRSRTNDFRYAIDDDTIRSIAAQLVAASQADWAALGDTVQHDSSDFVTSRPAYLPTILRVLAGPSQVTVVQPGEPDATIALRIILYEDGIDPTVLVGEGDEARTAHLTVGDGATAPESIEIDPNGTETVSALVTAGPDVERIEITNGSTTISVPLTQAFPDVFPTQRFGYVITGAGYWLEITLTNGTTQRDDLAPPGQ